MGVQPLEKERPFTQVDESLGGTLHSPQTTGRCCVRGEVIDMYKMQLVKRNQVVVLHHDQLAPYHHLSPVGDKSPTGTIRVQRQLPQHLSDFVVDTQVAGHS